MGQRCCSKTWDEGFKEFQEVERVKDFVQRLRMRGSKSFGNRTGQTKILFKDLG